MMIMMKKQSSFDYVNSHGDLDLAGSVSLYDSSSDDDAPSKQVWLHKVEWFRRYRPDTIRTQCQTDTVMPIYNFVTEP